MSNTTPSAVKPRPIPQATWVATDGLPARAAQVVEYARWTAEDQCGAGYLRSSIERDETSGEWIATVVTMLPKCRLSAPIWRGTAEEAKEAADQYAAQILEAMLGLGMSALCVEVEEGAEELVGAQPPAAEWPELEQHLDYLRHELCNMRHRIGECRTTIPIERLIQQVRHERDSDLRRQAMFEAAGAALAWLLADSALSQSLDEEGEGA